MTSSPEELSLREVSEAIRHGETTSVAVTESLLARIEVVQPRINCFISVDRDGAIAAAEVADREIAQGRWRGPLHGVPLAHKDAFDREGQITTAGTKIFDQPAKTTSTVMARFDTAGAVPLGRLNLDEFAAGGTGANDHFGRCRNPWNIDHITGGSSSGSGAAVAARLAYGALGGDAGGSIRIPAAMCGVVGLKPTFGRVSRYATAARTWTVDCTGPMCRTAEDCALMLQAIAGHDPKDPTTSQVAIPNYAAALAGGVRGKHIARAVGDPFDAIDDDLRAAMDDAVTTFRDLGATISEVPLPQAPLLNDLQQILVKSEAATINGRLIRTRAEDITFAAISVLQEGFLIPATRYLEAISLRGTLVEEFTREVFGNADILMLPVVTGRAPTIAETETADQGAVETLFTRAAQFTRFANYLGTPGVSVPCGFSSDGLPLGFQLLGPAFSEDRLLAAAHALQSATDFHRRSPPLD